MCYLPLDLVGADPFRQRPAAWMGARPVSGGAAFDSRSSSRRVCIYWYTWFELIPPSFAQWPKAARLCSEQERALIRRLFCLSVTCRTDDRWGQLPHGIKEDRRRLPGSATNVADPFTPKLACCRLLLTLIGSRRFSFSD